MGDINVPANGRVTDNATQLDRKPFGRVGCRSWEAMQINPTATYDADHYKRPRAILESTCVQGAHYGYRVKADVKPLQKRAFMCHRARYRWQYSERL